MNPNMAAHEVWLRTRFGEPATGKVTEQDLDRLQAYRLGTECEHWDGRFCSKPGPCYAPSCRPKTRRATPEQIEAAKAVETLPLTGKNLMYAALIVAVGAFGPALWGWM